jgi:branched-chain amino acid transport system substrate-binding protein
LETESDRKDQAQQRLLRLQASSKSHPLAPDIQAALQKRGPVVKEPPSATQPRAPQEPTPPQPRVPPALPAVAEQSIPLNSTRIGCLAPINGQYSTYGNQVVRGLTMAAEDYNQRHSDRPITVITKDTKDDQATTLRSFRELTQEQGVVGIVGPLSSQCVQAIAEPAGQLGVPLLTLTQRDEDSQENPYVFHVFVDNHQMLKSLVQHCRSKLAFKNFGVLYPNDRYGQKLAKAFDEAVREAGGSVLASVAYNPASTDFQEPLQKLVKIAEQSVSPTESASRGIPIDALFIPDQARTVALMAPQLPNNNIVGVQLLGTNLWSSPDLVKMGGIYVEQALFPAAYFAGSQDSKLQRFEDRFKELYQSSPSYLEAQAYDALALLLRALENTPPPIQRSAVVERLLAISNYDGLTGKVSFAPDGRLQRRYTIIQVSDGKLVQIAK